MGSRAAGRRKIRIDDVDLARRMGGRSTGLRTRQGLVPSHLRQGDLSDDSVHEQQNEEQRRFHAAIVGAGPRPPSSSCVRGRATRSA